MPEKLQLSTRELYEAIPALNRIIQLKPPVRIAFAMQKNIRKINNELRDVGELRDLLLEKYGVTDSETGERRFPQPGEDHYDENKSEWSTVLDTTHDIEIHQIPLSVINNAIEEGKLDALSVADYVTLWFMFNDDFTIE